MEQFSTCLTGKREQEEDKRGRNDRAAATPYTHPASLTSIFRFSADDSQMRLDQNFNLARFGEAAPVAVACCICLALLLAEAAQG